MFTQKIVLSNQQKYFVSIYAIKFFCRNIKIYIKVNNLNYKGFPNKGDMF